METVSYRTGDFEVERVPSALLDLFVKRNFLSPDECAGLIARIDANRRPSAIGNNIYNDSSIRTSETADLSNLDPFIHQIDRKLSAFVGLDPNCGEPLQGQRYAVGQEFKPHTDFFLPGGVEYRTYCSRTGNRTWTLMVYLNKPKAGGATRFTRIDKLVKPERGKLIFWNNLNRDGSVNSATMHHGMKVLAGTKYIITKWYRERPFV